MNTKSILIGILAVSPVLGFAQLTSTGPFTGQYSEGFESFNNYLNGGIFDTLSVFGGQGQLSSNPAGTNQLYVISPSNGASWGLGSNGTLNNVADGVNALGLEYNNPNGGLNPVDVTLTFAHGVSSFGGYFATDSNTGQFNLSFFDTHGNLIQTVDIYQATNTMYWQGWNSSTTIGSIEFTGNWAPAMDGLQINAVPEPASFAALALGGLALLKRRKTR